MTLAEALRAGRGEMSLREVSRKVGVSASTLCRVEAGSQPDLDSLAKICAWLGADVGSFVGDPKAPPRIGRIRSLVVGSGPYHQRRPLPHFETTLDLMDLPGVDVVHDLNVVPWPFHRCCFEEVVATHVVEHLRSLVAFMDEAWRVLVPGGSLFLRTPEAGVDLDLTHGDPTHVRCYRLCTFHNYFTPAEGPKRPYTNRYWCLYRLYAEAGEIVLQATAIKKLDGQPADQD